MALHLIQETMLIEGNVDDSGSRNFPILWHLLTCNPFHDTGAAFWHFISAIKQRRELWEPKYLLAVLGTSVYYCWIYPCQSDKDSGVQVGNSRFTIKADSDGLWNHETDSPAEHRQKCFWSNHFAPATLKSFDDRSWVTLRTSHPQIVDCSTCSLKHQVQWKLSVLPKYNRELPHLGASGLTSIILWYWRYRAS